MKRDASHKKIKIKIFLINFMDYARKRLVFSLTFNPK